MYCGSCLCGTVRFEIDGAFDHTTHCHCSICRKSHGAAFATYATCNAEQFRWIAGEDAIARRDSSPGFTRTFCKHCSTSLPVTTNRGVHVPAGCLDDNDGDGAAADRHIFTEFAAPWHVIADALPRYNTWDTDGGSSVEGTQAALGKAPDNVLRGSCLCGTVAFNVTEPIARAHNCHCSRCRKARAAAHASNAFTTHDGVQFTQGEDHIELFKLAEAQFFTVAFCRTCGSAVPRKDSSRNVAVIPMSALDDDPQRTVDSHIFIGSKASWYTPRDDIPKFDGPAK